MEGPAEGREPPPAKVEAKAKTRKQKPLFIGGIRCCPRCMTGGPRGKGGKHYSHDREAEDCVLRGSEAQGGMARKILKDAAENYEWEKGTKGILEPHRVDKRRRGTRTRPTRPAVPAGKPKPRRRTKRGKAIKARPATTTTSKSSPATESSKAEHQAEETDNTAVVVLKLKLVEHHPRRHGTTRTTSQRPRRPRQRRPAKQRGSDPGRGLARHPQLPAPGRQDEEAQQEEKEARGKVERHKGRDSGAPTSTRRRS